MAAYWVVEVNYPGYEPGLDDELEKVVGKDRAGSGAGFGQRDIDWSFDNEADAKATMTKLREFAKTAPAALAIHLTEHDDEE